MRQHRWTRLLSAVALAAGATLAGGGAAHADPPAGWGPGEYGLQADFADVAWTHQGRYEGVRGNWHTGWINIEEDDDVITGSLADWWCPAGAQPPGPYDPDQQSTDCKLRSSHWLEYIQYWDVATFDHATNRLRVDMDVPSDADGDGEYEGTVRVDLVISGVGKPVVTKDTSGEILDYGEAWTTTKTWGRVDGHRVRGPGTVQEQGRLSFYLDGWVRTA